MTEADQEGDQGRLPAPGRALDQDPVTRIDLQVAAPQYGIALFAVAKDKIVGSED